MSSNHQAITATIATTIKGKRIHVSLASGDKQEQQLEFDVTPKFQFDSGLKVTCLMVDSQGLIRHSHNELVWFDLGSGQVTAKYTIDRPLTEEYTVTPCYGEGEGEGREPIKVVKHYNTTEIWNDGKIMASAAVLTEYADEYILPREQQTSYNEAGEFCLTFNFEVEHQPKTAVYNLTQLLHKDKAD